MEYQRERVGGRYSQRIGGIVQERMEKAQTPYTGRGVEEDVRRI